LEEITPHNWKAARKLQETLIEIQRLLEPLEEVGIMESFFNFLKDSGSAGLESDRGKITAV